MVMNALRTASCSIQKKCRKCFVRVNSKKNSSHSSFFCYVSPLSREHTSKLRDGEDLNVAPRPSARRLLGRQAALGGAANASASPMRLQALLNSAPAKELKSRCRCKGRSRAFRGGIKDVPGRSNPARVVRTARQDSGRA